MLYSHLPHLLWGLRWCSVIEEPKLAKILRLTCSSSLKEPRQKREETDFTNIRVSKRKRKILNWQGGLETRLELRASPYEEIHVIVCECVLAHTLKYCEVKSKSYLWGLLLDKGSMCAASSLRYTGAKTQRWEKESRYKYLYRDKREQTRKLPFWHRDGVPERKREAGQQRINSGKEDET